MNAAGRRAQRRQIARDWPAGTKVTWCASPREYTVLNPARAKHGAVMILDDRGRHYASPGMLKRAPT